MSKLQSSKDDIPFLSICIPTYNRAKKTVDLVKSILCYRGYDIEVVVLDNCSTDGTQTLLEEIKDKRFIYKKNKINIGSMPNVLKVLSYGKGEYVMLCLDKDRILYEKIAYLIQNIRNDIDVVVGQCKLNTKVTSLDFVYEKGLSSLLNIAYTSEHPSGLFLKSTVLNNSGIIDKINKKDRTFAFNTELLKAEMCILGKSKRINIPIIETETLEVCKKEISHTYKGDNIYFFPKNIIKTLDVYINNLYSLDIITKDKNKIYGKVFSYLLISSTFGFKNIMKNNSICMHHGLYTRRINFLELLVIDYSFTKFFLKKDFPISFINKFYYCIIAHMKLVFIFLSSKFN